MAQTARAYDVYPQRRPREYEAPPLRALPGRKTGTRPQESTNPLLKTALITGAVCFLFIVAVSIVGVALSNATVQLLVGSEQVTESIADARAVGIDLEVQYSVATNPAQIQETAKSLGMAPDTHVEGREANQTLTPEARETILGAAATQEASHATNAETQGGGSAHPFDDVLANP